MTCFLMAFLPSRSRETISTNGNTLPAVELIPDGQGAGLSDAQLVRVYDIDGIMTAVYRYRKSDRSFKAYKMFI